jgi:hypothetical protein
VLHTTLPSAGDLVRWLPGQQQQGALEFLGQVDHHVKLRGFRIELQVGSNKRRLLFVKQQSLHIAVLWMVHLR